MIELRNVTKAYPVKNGLRYILRDVSLTIPSRTSMAVLGPNGAGKSTFLRLIGGAEAADSGMILRDEEISWPLGLSSGFQGSLTGRQNVQFVCRINGLRIDQTRQVLELVEDFAELGEYFDMPVTTYSAGMRSRLTFGLSMAFEFDVYLVDELTAVGDAIFREKAQAAFEHIRKRGSLIFVSHNLKTLEMVCQTALFLRDGEATFYPKLADGIDAYTDYIRAHRNHGHPKTTPPPRHHKDGKGTVSPELAAADRASRRAERRMELQLLRAAALKKRRASSKSSSKDPAPGSQPPSE